MDSSSPESYGPAAKAFANHPRRLALKSQQLADLAGVSVRTLRHYHQIGLLSEPPRSTGGYRLYGPRDVVRVLRIRRLAGSGLPLSQIGELLRQADQAGAADSAEGAEFEAMLSELDRHLADQIAELQSRRELLANLRAAGGSADLPPGYVDAINALRAGGLGEQDMRELRDLIELTEGLGSAQDRAELTTAIRELAVHPNADLVASLDQRLRDLNSSTSPAEVEALVSDSVEALFQYFRESSLPVPTTPEDPSWDRPHSVLALSLADSWLSAPQRQVFQRILAEVEARLAAELPPPATT
ncbi:MAG: MerR family transcriptional regulator [Bifidobacteriaceae bacterium]|nr:MerR family transcriptional regulator [Bifidobacteriaceae bacterium]